MGRRLLFLFALLIAQPLSAADWLRAESEHYVVHARMEEQQLRDVVAEMEAFRRMLLYLLPSTIQPGRKVELYLDRGTDRISWAGRMSLSGLSINQPEFVGSFSQYDERMDQFEVAKSIRFAQTVAYINNGFVRTLPPWVSTGTGALLRTTIRGEDGNFLIGIPDRNSPLEGGLSARRAQSVIETETRPSDDRGYSQFFRQSREMVRPLLFDPVFEGRMEQYLDAVADGATLEEAAYAVGDIEVLAEAVTDYTRANEPVVRAVLLSEDEAAAPATILTMTEDEVALVALRIARLRGQRVDTVISRTKRLTRRYPDSAEVWHEYAAAEYVKARRSLFGGEPVFRGFGFSNGELIVSAGRYSDEAAWEAVNRALALEPDHKSARVLKAEILLGRLLLVRDGDLSGEYDEVRALLEPLANQPSIHPLAAAVSYQTYLEQDIEPTPEALDRLGRAFDANRGVPALRYAYASALARVSRREEAELLLRSLVSNPLYTEAVQRALAQGGP